MACSWMGVGVSYPMAATPASRVAGEAELGERRQVDLRGGACGPRGMLALHITLVHALAAAPIAVAAGVAARAAAAAGTAEVGRDEAL